MGPRHCCRGIRMAFVMAFSLSSSFNGATALLPWNPQSRCHRTVSGQPRFNGATALLPWNPHSGGSEGPDHGASMGPRHCCRGILQPRAEAIFPLRLASMGPRHCCRGITQSADHRECRRSGFNGATALLPWNRRTACHSPRPLWCFNGATALLPWNHADCSESQPTGTAASMGPRHCCRGICEPVTRTVKSLTWLQWGHGIAAVESGSWRTAVSSRRTRFNGATALLPWNLAAIPESRWKIASFNGATALLPWNRPVLCDGR